MDLDSLAIRNIVHPTAAFHKPAPEVPEAASGSTHDESSSGRWDSSQLNPKNRIDSLDFPEPSVWRVDGSASLGTQYYAIPLFLDFLPPLRIDVFVAEHLGRSCPLLRSLLDLDRAFHTKDAARVNRLGITRHIVRALHLWSSKLIEANGVQAVADIFQKQPFGTKLIFENLALNIGDIKISVNPNHDLELHMLAAADLSSMWNIPAENLPPSISLTNIEFVEQLHDSVCIVRLPNDSGGGLTGSGASEDSGGSGRGRDLVILKALSSSNRYLYHELKILLTMEPHPNIIGPPLHLVTKPCNSGGKKGVIGFTLFYHRISSLRDHIPFIRIHGNLKASDQTKWAIQLTSAMIHIRHTAKTYYPDLRLDNVVLADNGDAVMVDLEQRGVWCEFGPPEVNNIELLRILACDDPSEFTGSDLDNKPVISKELRLGYSTLLRQLVPTWERLYFNKSYDNPAEGYNIAWKALTPAQQEAAEVYMLGRVLWCLFEGMAAPKRGAVWQSYRREPEIEFPNYSLTPPEIRSLIDRCTAGRRPAWSDQVARVRSRVCLKSGEAVSEAALRRLAKEWWTQELKDNGLYLDKEGCGADLDKLKQVNEPAQRPPLKQVLQELKVFEASLAASENTH